MANDTSQSRPILYPVSCATLFSIVQNWRRLELSASGTGLDEMVGPKAVDLEGVEAWIGGIGTLCSKRCTTVASA